MIVGVLAPIAVLGAIALVVILFLQRGKDGLDLSPRNILRLYLYLASLAGIVIFSIGVASAVNYTIARATSDAFIYGNIPSHFARPCPPGATGCVEPSAEEMAREEQRQVAERDRRRDEDLIRGVTYMVFGGLFWIAHWAARRGLGEQGVAGLRRGYLMLGTVVFGLATIVLLPTGIYQALSNALLASPEEVFRSGADALGGGIASLPIWLVYLRLVVSEFRTTA